MDFYLGIGGVVTYKNSGLAEIIKDIDLKIYCSGNGCPLFNPCAF